MKNRFFLSSLIVIASVLNFSPLYAMNTDADGGTGASSAKKLRREIRVSELVASIGIRPSTSAARAYSLRSGRSSVGSPGASNSLQINTQDSRDEAASTSGGATASLGSLGSADRSLELYSDSDKAIQKTLSTLENKTNTKLLQMWTDWRRDPECSKMAFESSCKEIMYNLKKAALEINEEDIVGDFSSAISSNSDFRYFFKRDNDDKPNNVITSVSNVWFLLTLLKNIDAQKYRSLGDSSALDSFTSKNSLPFILHYKENDLWKNIQSIEEETKNINNVDDIWKWKVEDDAKKLLLFAQALVFKNQREEVLKRADTYFNSARVAQKRSPTAFRSFIYAKTFYDAAFMNCNTDCKEDLVRLGNAVFVLEQLEKDTVSTALACEKKLREIIGFKDRIIKLQDKMLQK